MSYSYCVVNTKKVYLADPDDVIPCVKRRQLIVCMLVLLLHVHDIVLLHTGGMLVWYKGISIQFRTSCRDSALEPRCGLGIHRDCWWCMYYDHVVSNSHRGSSTVQYDVMMMMTRHQGYHCSWRNRSHTTESRSCRMSHFRRLRLLYKNNKKIQNIPWCWTSHSRCWELQTRSGSSILSTYNDLYNIYSPVSRNTTIQSTHNLHNITTSVLLLLLLRLLVVLLCAQEIVFSFVNLGGNEAGTSSIRVIQQHYLAMCLLDDVRWGRLPVYNCYIYCLHTWYSVSVQPPISSSWVEIHLRRMASV